MDAIKEYLMDLSPRNIWDLGGLIQCNSEFCNEVGLENYKIEKFGDLWVYSNAGDWHKDAEYPLKSKSLKVLKAFINITMGKYYKFKNRFQEEEISVWIKNKKMWSSKMKTNDEQELSKIQRGYGNPIINVIPALENLKLCKKNVAFSICLFDKPLLYLEEIKSEAAANYMLYALLNQIVSSGWDDDLQEESVEIPSEPVYPDWLDL